MGNMALLGAHIQGVFANEHRIVEAENSYILD
jgi:hypothetical protein